MFKEIQDYFQENKISKFRFKQLEDAIFKNFILDFEDITNYPKKLRDELKNNFQILPLILVDSQICENTIKFLLKTNDNNYIESVLMFHSDGRMTVCVSSQIFCALGCKFCATGANKFQRNLTTKEIIGQVLFISKYLKQKDQKITNVVFMGMGEPFLNYNNVIESLKILNDCEKFNIGARHITVSTSGIVPKIYDFANLDIQCRLAISLHAPNDKLRSQLMPINEKYPLSELIEACDNFTKKTNKKITYEYVLIKDINDTNKDAKELACLLSGKLAHVNILIYNPHQFSDFQKPSKERVEEFRKILTQKGIENSLRKSMGDDISGACGQLSGKQK